MPLFSLDVVPGCAGRTGAAPTGNTCPSAPGGSGILVDGDFSQASQPSVVAPRVPGASFAPYWTVSGPAGVDFLSTYFRTPFGLCSVDLDGSPGPGGIAHMFTMSVSQTYLVTFLLSANGAYPSKTIDLVLSAADSSAHYP